MKFNVYLLIEVYFIIELEIEFDSIVWGVLDSCYFFSQWIMKRFWRSLDLLVRGRKKGRNCHDFFLFDLYMNILMHIH